MLNNVSGFHQVRTATPKMAFGNQSKKEPELLFNPGDVDNSTIPWVKMAVKKVEDKPWYASSSMPEKKLFQKTVVDAFMYDCHSNGIIYGREVEPFIKTCEEKANGRKFRGYTNPGIIPQAVMERNPSSGKKVAEFLLNA